MSPDPYLPFVDHCAPRVMLLRDGSVMGMARLAGAPFWLAAGRERNGNLLRLTAFFNAIADDNVEAFLHFVRHDGVPAHPTSPGASRRVRRDVSWKNGTATWRRNCAPTTGSCRCWCVRAEPRSPPPGPRNARKRACALRAAAREDLIRDTIASGRNDTDGERAAHEDRLAQLEDAFSLAHGLLRQLGPVRLGERRKTAASPIRKSPRR